MKSLLKIGLTVIGLAAAYCFFFGILPIILDSPEVFHPPIYDLSITKPVIFGQSQNIKLASQISGKNFESSAFVVFGSEKALISELDGSLAILNISEPSQPHIIGHFELPKNSVIIYAKMQGDFAFLGMKDGLHILDVSDGAKPKIVSVYKTSSWVQRIAIDKTRAYLIDKDGGLYILDIKNPGNPRLLSYYKTLDGINFIKDIAVTKNYVYIVAKTIHIMDMSNPSSVKEVGSFSPYYGFDDYSGKDKIAVYDKIAFLNEGYKKGFDPVFMSYLTVLDISDPTKPTYILSYNWCRECSVGGISPNFLYLQMNNELHLVDFSSPRNPIELGYFGLSSDNVYEWYTSIGTENNIFAVDDQSNFYSLRYEK